MATLYAASSPVDRAAIGGPNGATQPIMIPTPLDKSMPSTSHFSTSHDSSRLDLPPPNPPFVFPARPSSASSSFSRAAGRRPRSVVELPVQHFEMSEDPADFRSSRASALPDFSFNPGAAATKPSDAQSGPSALPDFSFNPGASTSSDNSLLSPPVSPMTPRTIPARQGHRRFGSEFVGGNVKTGESITVMSTSPTRSEGGLPSPTLAPVKPPPRRGHAHRRSAAISGHDLSLILKPPSPNSRGSSAPTSPADFDNKPGSFPDIKITPNPEPEPAAKASVIPPTTPTVSISPSPEPSPEFQYGPRARVGFSDTLEFIPRPLSMVSTDTGSTATVRPGHSVSGSVSSITSATNTNAGRDTPTSVLGSPDSSKMSGSRPSTAGAVLERSQTPQVADEEPQSPRRRNSIPLLIGLPQIGTNSPANRSPTKTPKRWSFFGLDPFASSASPTKLRPHSPYSIDPMSKSPDPTGPILNRGPDSCVDKPVCRPTSGNSPVKKKKQKKVKNWAGSILTRTSKSRSRKKSTRKRSATPPVPRPTVDEELTANEEETNGAFEAPPPALMTEGLPPTVLITEPHSPGPSSPIKPYIPQDDDLSYQMIDLDAALGPFNTPSARDPQWEAAQRGGGATPRRQLHSAAGMRNFTGPGMHYHRRTESAPALAPFEPGRFGIPRFGSSSTMADVFEEDEEDEDDNIGTEGTSERSGTETRYGSLSSESSSGSESTPTQERDIGMAASGDNSPASPGKRKGSGSSLEMQPPGTRMRTETSTNSLHDDIIAEETAASSPYRRDRNFSCTSEASYSPAPSPRTLPCNKPSMPVDLNTMNLPAPAMAPASPYSTSHSSFPSPRSPVSYDAQRISTAPSSIGEENNFQSLLMGEPGPEVVRMSFEVPSLTSTNSTMTRDSLFVPPVQPRNMPFHEHRPASFTSTAFGRRRSSLAGLSRLIASAHGERSKLSVEVPCEDEPEKKPRTSKTRRFSRMVQQFWRPKEPKNS